jgi:outer membrane protein TolC
MKPFPQKITLIVLLAAALQGPSAGASPSAQDPVEVTADLVDQLVAEAQGRNPALQAAVERTAAAAAAAAAVRTWEDPTASFGLWAPGPGGFSSSAQGNIIYGLSEKLPLHGRPDLMRRVASADAQGAEYASDYETLKLRRDLRLALNGVAIAGREEEIAGQDVTWLDATLAAIDDRYRVGQASQVDWLRMQTARVVAGNDLTTRQQDLVHSAFALNRLLNRDLHTPWPRVAVPPPQPPIHYTERLVDAALSAEPRLRVMRQESRSAQAAADLTRSDRLPDVSVGIQAWQYSGDGGLRQAMATVSFSVPWLNRARHDDDWQRDQHKRRASDLAAQDYALSVRDELHHMIVDLDTARRQAALYQDQLIPLTLQTVSSSQAAWEHNVGPFQDVLDAHRMLLADQLALARALADQSAIVAEISLLTGSRDVGSLVALAGDPPPDHDGQTPAESK